MCVYCGNIYKNHSSELPNASDILRAGVLGTNQDLANYLTSGFWNEVGDTSRKFNLSNDGVFAKNGVLTYNTNSNIFDVNGISSQRSLLVDESFKLLESTLGIDFQKTNNFDADIRFSDSSSEAFAISTYSSGNINYTNINIPTKWNGFRNGFGNYTFQTILHEVGHALGLGHQGNYNGPTSYSNAKYSNDSWQSSIMSYFSQRENTSVNASFAYLSTYSAVDLIALEDLYSPQGYSLSNSFAGDTVYGFNTNISSSTSQIFSELSNWIDSTAFTIVDGSGNDTLDFSGFSNNQVIDLRPTERNSSTLYNSDIGGRIGNLIISSGTIIENAIGGLGNDNITGNYSNNIINGGNGDDFLIGGLGNDTYIVDSISDKVYENANEGADLIISSVSLTLPVNVEKITLTGSSDIDAIGNDLDNIFKVNSGNNNIDGSEGTDIVIFDGLFDNYILSLSNNNLVIEDIRSSFPNGITTLENIEIAEFEDITKTIIELLNNLHKIDQINFGASRLNILDRNTTRNIDASAVTTFSGNASDINTAYTSSGISGLENSDITISDTTINASLLNSIDGNTTGNIDASSVATFFGNASDINTTYASSRISGLGNEEITIRDKKIDVSLLNILDKNTTANVDASNLNALIGNGADALIAFNSIGISGLTFDNLNYLASYEDLLAAFGSDINAARDHYFTVGISEGRSFDSFDEASYLASHEDLLATFGASTTSALVHYLETGYSEGRSKDLFDENSYLASNTDLLTVFGSNSKLAIEHYINNGFSEGRVTDAFNEFSYIASHPDLVSQFGIDDGAAATAHYVEIGYSLGKAIDTFDEYGYIASYADLISAFGTDTLAATKHYISFGKSEGRLTDLFNAESYLNNYADLKNSFGTDLDSAKKHFIEYGFNEGRIG